MIATEENIKTERYRKESSFRNPGDICLYEAQDTISNSKVVVREQPIRMSKIMSLGQQEAARAAFAEKAKVLMAVRHESVQRVLDFFSETDRNCLVLEPVVGSDLAELLEKNKWAFPLHDVINWADQLLEALHYLHAYVPPLFHRDIRPQNIKLTPGGKIRLLGLGFDEKADAADANLCYMPLEQIWSGLDAASQKVIINSYDDRAERLLRQPPDSRSDIYAVGATLYHLLTGCQPADALTRSIDTLDGKPDPLRSPGEIDAGVPSEISDVLMRAMELRRENRYDSAVIMRQVLRTALVRMKEREAVESVEQEKLNEEWEKSLVLEDSARQEEVKKLQPVDEPVWLDREAAVVAEQPVGEPKIFDEAEYLIEQLGVAVEPGQIEIKAAARQVGESAGFDVEPEQIEAQMRIDLEAEHEKQQIEEQMWLDLEAERARVEEEQRFILQKRVEADTEKERLEEENRLAGEKRRQIDEASEREAERLLEKQRAADARKALLVQELGTLTDSDPLQPVAAPVDDDQDDDILEIPPARLAPKRDIHTTEEPLFVERQQGGNMKWFVGTAAFLVMASGGFFGMRSFLSTKTGDANQHVPVTQMSVEPDTRPAPPTESVQPSVSERSPESAPSPETPGKENSVDTPAGSPQAKNKPAAQQVQPQAPVKKPDAAPAKTPAPKKTVTVDDLIKDN